MALQVSAFMEAFVRTEILGAVAHIHFGTPKSNSMPGFLLEQLADQIVQAGLDRSVKILLLSSHGDRAFCAGASFDELIALGNLVEAQGFFGGFAKVLTAMKDCGKMVIVRVQGKVTGGGVGIACAADYCFATQDAAMALTEINLGIGPFVIGPFVERKIGKSDFMAMALDASFRSAEWAKARGIYQFVGKDIDEMDKELEKFVLKLSSQNKDSLSLLKKVAWEGTENFAHILPDRILMSASLVLDPSVKQKIGEMKNRLGKTKE